MLTATPSHADRLDARHCGSILQPFRRHRAPRLAQHPTGGRMMLFRQAFHDVCAPCRSGRGDRTEGAADRLRQRSTVLAPPGRARAKPDRPVGPETLRQSGRPFHQRHGCFLTSPSTPIAVASTRSSPRCSPSIWTTRRSSADRSAAMKSASRAVGSATNLREAADFDTPRSGRCLHVTLRQPDSAGEPARQHIDQHQVHRPASEPVLLRRHCPRTES